MLVETISFDSLMLTFLVVDTGNSRQLKFKSIAIAGFSARISICEMILIIPGFRAWDLYLCIWCSYLTMINPDTPDASVSIGFHVEKSQILAKVVFTS